MKEKDAVNATFGYDGDGRMVTATVALTTTPFGPRVPARRGETAYYVGNHFELVNGITHTLYYHMGKRIAMREGNTLNWLLTDHLGSTAMMVKASEAITGQLRYKAYGQVRDSWGITTTTQYHFTGQRDESTIGLYFYNARWYDAALGRFVQADTLVPQPGNPQALNRYSYVLNNPLRYVDPTGLFTEDEIKKYLGVATWKEVEAFFREGGLLAGRWGWLAVLRKAQLGDEVQFLEGYAGFWPAPGPGATVALRGTFQAEGRSLYIMGSASRVAASDAAQVGNAFLLSRGSEGGLPTPFGPYYAERTYADHYEFDASRVDWVGAGLDAGGIAADLFTLGIAGRLGNAAQIARRVGKAIGMSIGLLDLGYGVGQTVSDREVTGNELLSLATDIAGLWYPIWPDVLGLGLKFGQAAYVAP